jgi:hypothetical protein
MGNAAYDEPFQRFGGSGAAAVMASANQYAAAVQQRHAVAASHVTARAVLTREAA